MHLGGLSALGYEAGMDLVRSASQAHLGLPGSARAVHPLPAARSPRRLSFSFFVFVLPARRLPPCRHSPCRATPSRPTQRRQQQQQRRRQSSSRSSSGPCARSRRRSSSRASSRACCTASSSTWVRPALPPFPLLHEADPTLSTRSRYLLSALRLVRPARLQAPRRVPHPLFARRHDQRLLLGVAVHGQGLHRPERPRPLSATARRLRVHDGPQRAPRPGLLHVRPPLPRRRSCMADSPSLQVARPRREQSQELGPARRHAGPPGHGLLLRLLPRQLGSVAHLHDRVRRRKGASSSFPRSRARSSRLTLSLFVLTQWLIYTWLTTGFICDVLITCVESCNS